MASALKSQEARSKSGELAAGPLVKGVGCVYCWRKKKRSFVRSCGKGGWIGAAA